MRVLRSNGCLSVYTHGHNRNSPTQKSYEEDKSWSYINAGLSEPQSFIWHVWHDVNCVQASWFPGDALWPKHELTCVTQWLVKLLHNSWASLSCDSREFQNEVHDPRHFEGSADTLHFGVIYACWEALRIFYVECWTYSYRSFGKWERFCRKCY